MFSATTLHLLLSVSSTFYITFLSNRAEEQFFHLTWKIDGVFSISVGKKVVDIRFGNHYSGAPDTLGYWRTKSGVEVDFVLYGERDFAAIEVKNAATLRPYDFSGLKSFREDYPEARPVLLYRGKERFLSDGVLALPVEDFLRALVPGRPPLDAF